MNSYKSFFKTDLAGMSVHFSPFEAFQLAYTASANFGIVGKGKLMVMSLLPNGQMEQISSFDEPDAVFDCSWSETQPNLIFIGCGDGSVKVICRFLIEIVFVLYLAT